MYIVLGPTRSHSHKREDHWAAAQQYCALCLLTFHPDGDLGTAVVSPGTLCGQEVAGGGLEGVPAGLQLAVAHRHPAAHTEVVVETALRLARYHLVVACQTGVCTGHQPADHSTVRTHR